MTAQKIAKTIWSNYLIGMNIIGIPHGIMRGKSTYDDAKKYQEFYAEEDIVYTNMDVIVKSMGGFCEGYYKGVIWPITLPNTIHKIYTRFSQK